MENANAGQHEIRLPEFCDSVGHLVEWAKGQYGPETRAQAAAWALKECADAMEQLPAVRASASGEMDAGGFSTSEMARMLDLSRARIQQIKSR